MARYRGTIQGSRGEASRLGTPKSGLVAEVNGWTIGVRVEIRPDPYDATKDVIRVYRTSGSADQVEHVKLIANVTQSSNIVRLDAVPEQ